MGLSRTLPIFMFVLLLFSGATLAEPRIALQSPVVNLTSFQVGYYIDDSQTLGFDDVRQQSFKETSSTTTLGTNARVTWFRIPLDNQTDQELALNVHLPHAYHVRSVAFYQERDGQLVHSDILDLEDVDASGLMFRGSAVYPITLPAQSSTTLYVRSDAYSHQWFALEIFDQEHSRQALVGVANDIALLVGMMVALVFYNLLLYLATSKIENIYYSFYLISGLVWIALSYGLVASLFDAYGHELFMLNISLITMPIFLLLFMMAIFETRQHYPIEHRFLQAVLIPLCAMFVWGLFDISAALKPASSMALIMMTVTLSVSVSLLRKGHPLAKYFLVGHTLFVIFNALAVLFYKGLIEPSYLASHGTGLGIMLEALMLAFIISHRIKILEDIRASQEELKEQASTDPLTSLHNRRYFSTEAEFLLALCREQKRPMAVMIADIDHFKRVNDTWGHPVGDRVIVRIAQTLKSCCRSRDLLARFGGEEFVILLPDADLQQAALCAERIRATVATTAFQMGDGDTAHVSLSIGVALVDVEHDSIQSALDRADQALYTAKQDGRNRVAISEAAAAA
ncbi:GGDEF domain-containing protein [Halopseudomonas pachastrellae]|uniref:diguanylate cyclase n=1 Tax=Halopseudomonas pachastrellae TaxID=254161 RepID=A0A1S8DIM9_9GAMM|nr:diguanylate cyclase [Halopseudomonas pachastrellae]ONM44460.1 GGDEF domain-containing protein [Halopseudomonas pachastrellae]SFM83834.1 diguanylate cyclase (GGDEF) domain-containing protein [Halopseudomonas pachastrellae]